MFIKCFSSILGRSFMLFLALSWLVVSFASAQFSERVYVDSFKAKNFPSVFAQASLFREANTDFDSIKNIKTYDNVFSIEIISLAKYCQWGIIDELISTHDTLIKAGSLLITKQVKQHLNLKKEYKAYKTDKLQKKQSLLDLIKSKRDHWNMSVAQARDLTQQQNLVIQLESVCKK